MKVSTPGLAFLIFAFMGFSALPSFADDSPEHVKAFPIPKYLDLKPELAEQPFTDFDSFAPKDIRKMVDLFKGWTGKPLEVAPDLKGNVSLNGPFRVGLDEMYNGLIFALESNGLEFKKEENRILIQRDAGSKRRWDEADILPTRLYRLAYLNPRTVLDVYLAEGSGDGRALILRPYQILVVTDTKEALDALSEFVDQELLDTIQFDPVRTSSENLDLYMATWARHHGLGLSPAKQGAFNIYFKPAKAHITAEAAAIVNAERARVQAMGPTPADPTRVLSTELQLAVKADRERLIRTRVREKQADEARALQERKERYFEESASFMDYLQKMGYELKIPEKVRTYWVNDAKEIFAKFEVLPETYHPSKLIFADAIAKEIVSMSIFRAQRDRHTEAAKKAAETTVKIFTDFPMAFVLGTDDESLAEAADLTKIAGGKILDATTVSTRIGFHARRAGLYLAADLKAQKSATTLKDKWLNAKDEVAERARHTPTALKKKFTEKLREASQARKEKKAKAEAEAKKAEIPE